MAGRKLLVISTFYGLPFFTSASVKNHLSYCLKHSYDYVPYLVDKPTDRQFSWAKIVLLQKHISAGQHDAVFWMDGDSLFLNQEITLDSFLDARPEPIQFTGDENDIFNGGHILLRCDQVSLDFLGSCWQICKTSDKRFYTTHKDDSHIFDQPAILAVLGGASPQHSDTWADGFNAVNGFPENPYRKHLDFQAKYSPSLPENCSAARSIICNQWRPHCFIHPQRAMNSYPWFMRPDDFIVHFVGNTKHLIGEWHEHFRFYPN